MGWGGGGGIFTSLWVAWSKNLNSAAAVSSTSACVQAKDRKACSLPMVVGFFLGSAEFASTITFFQCVSVIFVVFSSV